MDLVRLEDLEEERLTPQRVDTWPRRGIFSSLLSKTCQNGYDGVVIEAPSTRSGKLFAHLTHLIDAEVIQQLYFPAKKTRYHSMLWVYPSRASHLSY